MIELMETSKNMFLTQNINLKIWNRFFDTFNDYEKGAKNTFLPLFFQKILSKNDFLLKITTNLKIAVKKKPNIQKKYYVHFLTRLIAEYKIGSKKIEKKEVQPILRCAHLTHLKNEYYCLLVYVLPKQF